ncbi:MAG TPA: glycogen/starch synthase, partial [Bryobacteraceae bacterium]|nr:glycogen/starch synthase [Bryobacteraceae bacterium]
MRILIAASEATPYAKTGGLADVIGALPFALKARGEDVAVVLPLHRSVAPHVLHADRVYDKMPLVLGSTTWEVSIRRISDRGVPIYFVDCPPLFDRPGVYGEGGKDYPDSDIRFGAFCHAILEIVRSLFRPHVIHCHDWQTALVAPLIHSKFKMDPTFYGIKTLLTIHNLGYQGLFPKETLTELGLPRELMTVSNMEFFGQLNFLKGGIVFSDGLTTVSKAYAREIQTPEYGFGLDGLLRDRADVLTGVVNGVDYAVWSPDHDSYIAARYDIDDLKGKEVCKRDLLET